MFMFREASSGLVRKWALALMILLIILAFSWVTMRILARDIFGDYHTYIIYAQNLIQPSESLQPISHFLFYSSIALTYQIYPSMGFDAAAVVASVGFYLLAGAVIFYLLWPALNKLPSWGQLIVGAILPLSLMIVMPASLLTPDPPRWLYFGYIPLTPYHNPTTTAAKPFALLLTLIAIRAFAAVPEKQNHTLRQEITIGAIAAFITVLSILAKPSHMIAFVPALGLYTLFHRYFLRQEIRWSILIGILAAAVPLLLVQFVFSFGSSDNSSIILAPFVFFTQYEALTWRIGAKFLLSILFPAAVYLLYFPAARRSLVLNVSWLAFFAGAAYAYFIGETGTRAQHGNFLWSATMTLYVLFILSMHFFLQRQSQRDWRLYLLWAFYLLHVISGILWFSAMIRGEV